MNFVSLGFLLFTLGIYALYWAVPGFALRKLLLVVASYAFYAVWDWRFCCLMAFVTLNAWAAGRCLPSLRPRGVKWLLAGSITIDLLVLGFFKYYSFFVGSFAALLGQLGLQANLPLLNVILPVGISFYTFHAISYVVDVKRGKVASEKSMLNVALYIAFFPQLIAGPIVRSSFFMPQLRRARRFSRAQQTSAAGLIVRGLIYKAVVADMLAKIADRGFNNVAAASPTDHLTGSVAFYGQIYFDFAGYTLLAMGTARLFGYRLPRNFNFPYAAASLTDFWRRWHMSLSFWLRDYVYISLGGNKGGTLAVYRNLMLTMLLGGLWHGASWTFVFWGFLHGVGLCAHKFWSGLRPGLWPRALLARTGYWGALALTQLWVLVGWVFFRAASFSDALLVLRSMSQPGTWLAAAGLLGSIMLFVGTDHYLGLHKHSIKTMARPLAHKLYWLGAGALLALAFMLMQLEQKSFIYFQF